MASHPYISGASNITQMITFLRKNFPATVTSETVKKLGLASNNESYVINALQFLGLIDEEGKRTGLGQNVMAIHDDSQFQKAFADLVKGAYKELFELRGDDAWTLERGDLIGYFRSADKTSDVIGGRQASVFQALKATAGYQDNGAQKSNPKPKPASTSLKSKTIKNPSPKKIQTETVTTHTAKKDVAVTVRIEINLPAEASAETYDNIFKSMKANLLNE